MMLTGYYHDNALGRTTGKPWIVWFRDALGSRDVHFECFADALAFHNEIKALDILLRANSV